MGFSEFEFRPMGSFRYIRGYLVWRVQEKQARISVLDRWKANLGAPLKCTKFRQLMVRRITQTDYC